MVAIKATGRSFDGDLDVVKAMPKGEGEEVEVFFFELDLSDRGGLISDDDLEKQYELRDLDPADPYSLAAINEADRFFADKHPNGTHWKNARGKWCYIGFCRIDEFRGVVVGRTSKGWRKGWWFAGVRKP